MQEQHPYKITPEQGWSNMVTILDKAMPVERSSRRPIVFWWAAAAVTTAAIIFLFAMMNQQSSHQPSLAKESTQLNNADQPINGDQHVLDNQNETALTESGLTTTADENGKNTIEETEADKRVTRGNEEKTSKKIAAVDQKNSSTKKSSGNLVKTNEIVSSELATAELQKEESENSTVVDSEIEGPGEDRKSMTILDQLQSNSVAFITTDMPGDLIADDIQPNVIASQTGKRLFVPYVSANGFQGFTSGLGIQGKVGVGVNLNSKLSLTADLGYSAYHPDASAFGSAAQDLQENADVLRDDLSYQGIGNYLPAEFVNKYSDNVEPFLKAIYQWQFSAGVKYDLSRKFFAQAGATLGFGTTTRSSYPIVESNYPSTGAFFNIRNSFDSYDVIRSTMTSFYGGLGYRLSNRIELFANVNYGFDHYLLKEPGFNSVDATESNDYIRGIAVGMRYNFSGP